jgi:hypothetical protein
MEPVDYTSKLLPLDYVPRLLTSGSVYIPRMAGVTKLATFAGEFL